MLKKFFILIILPFLLLTGCTNQEKETINFASWGSVTEVKIIKQIISDFEKDNPDLKINFMHIPQNYFQKIHLLIASNTAPDVIFINNLNIPMYSNYLLPIEEFVNFKDFYPQAIKGLSYDNHLYAVPRDISSLLLYVNLDKANLPDENWSIDDLTKIAAKSQNNNNYGISYEDKVYWTTPYLTYFGGGILNKDGDLIIDNKESVKGISFYKNMKKRGIAPSKAESGSLTQAQLFIDGELTFYLSGRWIFPKISESAKFNWAVINFPYGQKAQYLDVSGWAISKNTKHKDASLKFVKYLSSENASEYFTSTDLIVPARIDAAKYFNKNNHNEKIFIDVIKHSINTPVNKDYQKIIDKININLDL